VQEGSGSTTELRIALNSHADHPEFSPCAQQRRMRQRMGPQMHDVFPAFVGPIGAQQRPQGGGVSGDQWYTSATLQTELALAAVRRHYERQLREAGWRDASSGESGPVAWSAWDFTEDGQPLRGLLLILQEPEGQGEYSLFLQARALNPRNPLSSGGFSYSPRPEDGGGWTASALSTRLVIEPGRTEVPGEGRQEQREETSGEPEGKRQ
jgi:hypothetical protein